MRILYVRREYHTDPWYKRYIKEVRRNLFFNDQDGFFEQSLFSINDVVEVPLRKLPYVLHRYEKEFDAVVINSKCGTYTNAEEQESFIINALKDVCIPKAFFIGAAQARWMPKNSFVDVFDVVFKREPFKDRTKYALSPDNQRKIVPTMIYCPFAPQARKTLTSKIFNAIRPRIKQCSFCKKTSDVFFVGALSGDHSIRSDVWERVVSSGVVASGGLQYHPRHRKHPLPHLVAPRIIGRRYREAICSSKINLALDGIGEFTFRHLELLHLGAFMISSPSVREVELPMGMIEDIHYVTYNSLDELEEKIRFYLANPLEREKIARAGHELYRKEYDPVKHGLFLTDALKKIT